MNGTSSRNGDIGFDFLNRCDIACSVVKLSAMMDSTMCVPSAQCQVVLAAQPLTRPTRSTNTCSNGWSRYCR